MSAYSRANSSEDNIALSLRRFLRLLLLRDKPTRQEIAKSGGFSPASVTISSKWLTEHEFLRKVSERTSNSKRPVERLNLRCLPLSVLAVRLSSLEVASDLLDSTGTILSSQKRDILNATQAQIFKALGEEILVAQARADELGKPMLSIVLSVDGQVSHPDAGMIFNLNGLEDWQPCAPKAIHPIMSGFHPVTHWTQAVCKLHGLARRLQTDDHVAYFDVRPRDLHFAMMHNGVVTQGEIGTSGNFLHQTVQAKGPACFCGRPGCLDALLRAGEATPEMVFGAIQRLIEKERIQHVGIEWKSVPADVEHAIQETLQRSLVMVNDGREIEFQGLSLLGVETTLLHRINALQSMNG
ncbi:MAG: ROK family protein [Puniceicoccales bacterium]